MSSDSPLDPPPEYLEAPDGLRLAYHRYDPARDPHLANASKKAPAKNAMAAPTIVFLGGYASDMSGTKALFLEAACRQRGQPFVRLDYSGHGASGGRFEDGTISRWAADAQAVIEAVTDGKLVLVGSSMGGWVALLLLRALGARVAGLVGIAAAPDFTSWLEDRWSAAQKAELARAGRLVFASDYGGETVYTARLIEDGRANRVLDRPIAFDGPVHLLQGMQDPDVPWRTALAIADQLTSNDVTITLVKDGDHRLSQPADLARLDRAVRALCETVASPRSAQ